ncbi:MAG: YkgJ family cysteine cluster protein [Sedimentisphaerales bacterium]|nr:YkgJ family cysteine cluster protein [Sedimentisphaerales bacterium]
MADQEGQLDWDTALEALARLYELVDRQARALAAVHKDRICCRKGCSSCCKDGLTVFELEAMNIRRNHAGLLQTAKPHEVGMCAFLDEQGACRIYPSRPYVCRTEGLPLRWIDQMPDGSPVEMRDICPLNDQGPAIETLDLNLCWTIGPVEEALAELEAQCDGGRLRRVGLRELFAAGQR